MTDIHFKISSGLKDLIGGQLITTNLQQFLNL